MENRLNLGERMMLEQVLPLHDVDQEQSIKPQYPLDRVGRTDESTIVFSSMCEPPVHSNDNRTLSS